VFALTANLTLLLNMARRLSFKIAQPITIWGFWIASVLLIALIAVASSHKLLHKPGVRHQALTQAYYYAVFAAGLYQIISYMVGEINKLHEQDADTTSCKMMFTIYGALKGHYSKEFKLTLPQRTLMLQTICLLGYLLLGALVYSKIEGWKFLDAVYWADFTLLTIGIGDYFTPKTHLGRSLLFPFAIGGIVYLGLVVGSIRSLLLERTKKKLGARMTEKMRRRVIKKIAKAENSSNPVNKILGLDKKTSKCLTLSPHDDEEGERKRREAEFHAMRLVQDMAEKERKWVSLTVSGLAWLFLVSLSIISLLTVLPTQP
jgi:potassium channel subfamily K